MRYTIAILVIALFFVSCADKQEVQRLTDLANQLRKENQELKAEVETASRAGERLAFLSARLEGIKARISTNFGNIELEFFADKAPLTVFSFISRAESGFYDNTKFHRIIKGFMIQGGDPNSKDDTPYNDGQGGPIVNIPHEFNDVKHQPGVISMARVSNVNAGAGSQFFIMHGTADHLDHQYTAFGRVAKGMDVVDKIANVKTNQSDPRLRDQPVTPVVIKTIEVFR